MFKHLGKKFGLSRLLFSTQTPPSSSGSALKKRMRALFKVTHPDLFHDAPYEQSINQTSFVALQNYLQPPEHLAGSGDAESERRSAVRLRFFLRNPDQRNDDIENPPSTSNASSSPPSSTFREVTATLPPPVFLSATSLAPPCRKALDRLLASCGLEPLSDIGGTLPDSEYRSMRLSEFLQEAAEAQRQRHMTAETGALSLPTRIAILRNAFRKQRGISTAFAGSLSKAQRLQLLHDLAKAVDLVGHVDLSGTFMIFAGPTAVRNSVDPFNGDLWLQSDGTPADWARFWATEVNWAMVRDRQRQLASQRAFAARAAELLGVHRIEASTSIERSPEYRRLLLSLIEYAGGKMGADSSRRGAAPDLSNVHLLFSNDAEVPGSGRGPGTRTARVEEGLGSIVFPFPYAAEQVVADLQALGPSAHEAARKKLEERERIEQLKTRVTRRLRLRALLKDDLIAPSMFSSGAYRLLEHGERLQNVLEGLVIRIAEANRVADDAVEVAWNFEP